MRVVGWLTIWLKGLLILALLAGPATPSLADLRAAPTWWDPDGIGTGQDWHYRLPITIPAGTPANSTIKIDVNFNTLMAQMGITGTFDAGSPVVINASGAVVPTQEFNSNIFAGATNATAGRGEMRFLLDVASATTYYIYFDITQNGTKALSSLASPPAPINGNFERGTSAAGVVSPTNWTGTVNTAGYLAQVRPSETVPVTRDSGGANVNTDGTPNTGSNSYLLGWRSSTADPGSAATGGASLTRTIAVPSTNPGNLVFRYRPEGWDSVFAAAQYDYMIVDVLNSGGTVLATLVGPTTTANPTTAAAYKLYPASPNFGTAGGAISATTSGYGNYNYIDCDTTGTHRNGNPSACGASTWYTVSQSLTAWAGTTITLRFRAFSVAAYQSWYSIDDVEWSVVTATAGVPQGWGINISAPAAGTTYVPGQVVPLTVVVDANPTAAANTMTVNLYDSTGALAVSGIVLTKSAGNTWTSAVGLTIPLSATTTTGWTIRAFGLESSTSTVSGVTAGLVQINGAGSAMTQANFFNIDDILVNVSTAAITVAKTSSITSDPVNGTTNPKIIPGAIVHYCILVTNGGPQTATAVKQTDALPASITYVAGTLHESTTCALATASSTPATISTISGTTITSTIGTMASAATYAVVFDATIN